VTDALETDKQGNSLLRRLVLYLRWPAAICMTLSAQKNAAIIEPVSSGCHL
jgi:hypothetical protein